MPEITRRLINRLFPVILLVFVTLYVLSLSVGNGPELALFRAGGASILLAVLGRLAIRILENAALQPEPRQVPTVQPTPRGPDPATAQPEPGATAPINAARPRVGAVGEGE